MQRSSRAIVALSSTIALLLGGLLLAPSSASHESAISIGAKKYSSCKKLNKTYPAGVAKSVSASKKAVKAGFKTPEVNGAAYKANKSLDKDKDGVVCEKKKKSKSPASSDVPACVAVNVGYTYVPGADWLPFAAQIANRNAQFDAVDVWVDVNVTSGTRIIKQESLLGDRLPSGQTAWIGDLLRLRQAEDLTAVDVTWKVRCDKSAKSGDTIVTGPSTIRPYNSTGQIVESEILNSSNRTWESFTSVYTILFDAAGSPLGGSDNTISADSVPPGFSISEEAWIGPSLPQAASAIHVVWPE